jgi:hypothetical protein
MKCVIFLTLVFLIFLNSLVIAQTVNSCDTLNSAGNYLLENNITSTITCFNVTSSDIILDLGGFTITGQGSGYGINISSQNNITIKNGKITNFTRAISLENVTYSLIKNSTFFSNIGVYSGVYAVSSNNNNITGIQFNYNNASHNSGIYLNDSNSTRIVNNTFLGNLIVLDGENLFGSGLLSLYYSNDNFVFENNFTSNSIEIQDTYDLFGGGVFGLFHSSNNNIISTRILNSSFSSNEITGAGLFGLYSSPNNYVSNVTITGCDVTSRYNDFNGGGALGLASSLDNNISFINISNNTLSSGSKIIGGGAFGLHSSTGNLISSLLIYNNTITSDSYVVGGGALGFYGSSNNNLTLERVIGNTISLFGVEGGGGVGFDGSNYNNLLDLSILENSINTGGSFGYSTSVRGNIVSNLNASVDEQGYVIRDASVSETNYLIYNNTYGKISWTASEFLEDLDVRDNLVFGSGIIIDNNSAYLNSSHFSTDTGINSSANITLRGMDGFNFSHPVILRDGVECNISTSPACYNFTLLSSDIVTFNVSSWSTYSIGEFNTFPNLTTVILNSSIGNNFTNENLSCFALAEDALTMNLTLYYRWYVNGVLNVTGFATNVTNGSLSLISSIPSVNTSIGENWTCSVLSSDGFLNSTSWSNSSSLGIIEGCGDGISNGDETCSSCSADVGACESSVSGSSGGRISSFIYGTQLLEGYSFKLIKGYRAKVLLENGESHYIELVDFGINFSRIKVYSEILEKELLVGDEWKIDLDSDKTYDLLLRLENSSSRGSSIYLREINEAVKYFPDLNETKFLDEEKGNLGSSSLGGFLFFWIILLVFILGLIYLLFRKFYLN